jgi:hypothetical protein
LDASPPPPADDAGPDPNGDDLSAMDAELSQLLKGLTGGGDEGPI